MQKNTRRGDKKIRRALLLLLAALLLLLGWNRFVRWSYPQNYSGLVEQNAARFALPSALLYALIRTESGFDPAALSSAGARGLTQITPDTFAWLQTKSGEALALESLFEAEVSIRYGAFFLRMLLDEFGSEATAVAAYHAGRGQVNAWLRDPVCSADGKTLREIPFPETRHYVEKVTKAAKRYAQLYE
ncbi:MAG: lytic transglycosylase domain-containing protein [Oscillospiraceae bacterium]|nr:lytic transglycosylase domain-containing protein [Oscillospiraceae bacterium]